MERSDDRRNLCRYERFCDAWKYKHFEQIKFWYETKEMD